MDVKKIKDLAVAVSVIAVAAAVWYAVIRLDSRLASANQSISDSADLLDTRMETESARYAGLLEAQSAAWRTLADRQATAYRASLERESAALRGQIVWAQVMEVRPVRESLVSTLREHEALTQELRAQVADLYPDVSAAVQSSTVAARGVAEAAESTGKAMPRIASSAEIVASEAAKAAPDARRTVANVERMTRPPGIIVKILGFFGKLLF